MRIGYACLALDVKNTNFRSVTMKNASEEKLLEIIEHNLKSLNNIIDYNIENNIKLFRITSDLIPFGSSPVNTLNWWEIFSSQFKLNGNKEEAIERFIQNYRLLNKGVKERLVIENDDKSYNIKEVLSIGNRLDIPVIYDNLHNNVLPYDKLKDDNYWVNKCKNTWKREDGPQKIHYSQQDKNKRPGAHSETIEVEEFVAFMNNLDNYEDIDIMLEVKDKNLSAIKCTNMQ